MPRRRNDGRTSTARPSSDGTGLHVGEPFRTVAGTLSGSVVNLVSQEDPIDGVLPPSF